MTERHLAAETMQKTPTASSSTSHRDPSPTKHNYETSSPQTTNNDESVDITPTKPTYRPSSRLNTPPENSLFKTPRRSISGYLSCSSSTRDYDEYSSRPVSRDLPQSADSNAPILARHDILTARQPNKLVKRSISRKDPSFESLDAANKRKYTFRRPPTSNDRSQRLSTFSDLEPGPAGQQAPHSAPARTISTKRKSYKQMIDASPTVSKPSHARNQRYPSAPFASDGKFAKHNSTLAAPVKQRSSSVNNVTGEGGLASDNSDSEQSWASRPVTPRGATPLAASAAADDPYTSQDQPASKKARRSFSITDLLGRAAPAWKMPAKISKRKSHLASDGLHSSVPVVSSDGITHGPHTNVSPAAARFEDQDVEYIHEFGGTEDTSPAGSPVIAQQPSTHLRHHVAPSESTSSRPDSDIGTRVFSSAECTDGEMRSETAFDSMRTAATLGSSPSGQQPLGDLFSATKDTHLGSNANISQAASAYSAGDQSPAPTNISSPSHTVLGRASVSPQHQAAPRGQDNLPSASAATNHLNLGTLAWNSSAEKAIAFNSDDDDADEDWNIPTESATGRGSVHFAVESQRVDDASKAQKQNSDYQTRNSLFDWSEQQPIDRSAVDSTPPRPKTVHGKKDTDPRGSRTGERATPGVGHSRSHSVPAVPDVATNRSNITTKFGTWGIGSKGVSEDWDEDFEFGETQDEAPKNASETSNSSFKTVTVPEAIRRQQGNVLANIGLLRDWGLMIEELKELRLRALTLGIPTDQHASTFDEIDAMIDLADQEVESDGINGLIGHDSTSELDWDEVDERKSPKLSPQLTPRLTPLRSTLEQISPAKSTTSAIHDDAQSSTLMTRPRKDSEAVARSVIEALQRRRTKTEASEAPTAQQPNSKKLPFDTATLKHIVPYVHGLMRKAKAIIRDAEGLHTSPLRSNRAGRMMTNDRDESPSAHLGTGALRMPTFEMDEDDLEEQLGQMNLT